MILVDGVISFGVRLNEAVGYDPIAESFTRRNVVVLEFKDKPKQMRTIDGEIDTVVRQLFDQGIPMDLSLRCIRNGSEMTFVFSSPEGAALFRRHVEPLFLLQKPSTPTKDRLGVALCYQATEKMRDVVKKYVKLPPNAPIAASL